MAKEKPSEAGCPAQPTGPTLWLLKPSEGPSRLVTEFGSCEVRYFSNKKPQLVISPSAAAKTKIAVIMSQKRPFPWRDRRPVKARRSHRPRCVGPKLARIRSTWQQGDIRMVGMFPPRVSYSGPILHEISGLLLREAERDQRLSAAGLGGMFAVTCHPLGPPEVAGPPHPPSSGRIIAAPICVPKPAD
jgi:hypothetical protein